MPNCPECDKPMEGPLAGVLDQAHPPFLPAEVWFCPEGGCRVESVWRPAPKEAPRDDL